MSPLRARLEPLVRRWWAGEGGGVLRGLDLAALPLAALYRAGVGARGLTYRSGLRRTLVAPIPVISVGNLVVGGTGKTPVTAWLARRLHEAGARPAVLLRGYGEDEVRLHRRWNPQVPVVVGADRVRAAHEAARRGAGVAVLDDGFQHRRLARDLDLVLVAAEQPFPGRLLPRGPYREGAAALARAHLVAVTWRTASDARVQEVLERVRGCAPGRPVLLLRLEAAGWSTLGGAEAEPPEGELTAVTGVAEPESFRRVLEEVGRAPTRLLAFPDHHPFDGNDALAVQRAARGGTVAVTEKDAVKLADLEASLPPVRVLRLEVRLQQGGDALGAALDRVLGGGDPR